MVKYTANLFSEDIILDWPKSLLSFFQNRLNITKTIRKFSIDHDLKPTGSEFHPGPVLHLINHGDEVDEGSEGSVSLKAHNFDQYLHQ